MEDLSPFTGRGRGDIMPKNRGRNAIWRSIPSKPFSRGLSTPPFFFVELLFRGFKCPLFRDVVRIQDQMTNLISINRELILWYWVK